MSNIKLVSIPDKEYTSYKYDLIFNAYKWDPQVEDHNTVSKYVVLIDRKTREELKRYAEELSKETIMIENYLSKNLNLIKDLNLPKKCVRELNNISNYKEEEHIRLMRFDFHPTEKGWAISEVNSDVPGGLSEASLWPKLANKYFKDYEPSEDVSKILLKEFKSKLNDNSTVAFVHATSYSDDRQVMQFLGDYFDKFEFNTLYLAPDHIKWKDNKAYSILEGNECEIDGIFRFFPLEWLNNLPRKSGRFGYYSSKTLSCNHPISLFAQTKRLPLIWDKLDFEVPTWKKLLPATKKINEIPFDKDKWVYKPALGRVGEGIYIEEALSIKEMKDIKKDIKKHPKEWIMQEKFKSKPVITEDNKEYHLCMGVFTVNSKFAGYYARVSEFPRIDGRAKDIPVLVEKGD